MQRTAAVLAEAIYKKPTNLNIEGMNWIFLPSISREPIIGVWVNNASKNVFISIRGTANLNDVITDINVLNNTVRHTTHYKEAKKVLNDIRRSLPNYKINLTGHSLGGSIAVALGKENPDVKAYGFNPGTSYKTIPQTLTDRAMCKIFKWKRRCHDNVKQITTKNGADPISFISRLDGAHAARRAPGMNIHTISNHTHGVDVKPLEPEQQKPAEQEPAEDETGGSLLVPHYMNKTRMHDDMISNVYQDAIRNGIMTTIS